MVKLYHTPCTYCNSKITWIPSHNTEEEVFSDSRVLVSWSILISPFNLGNKIKVK